MGEETLLLPYNLIPSLWIRDSLGTPVSATNKTDRHDITDILLNVALNTINPSPDFRAFIVLSHLFVPVLLNTRHKYVR